MFTRRARKTTLDVRGVVPVGGTVVGDMACTDGMAVFGVIHGDLEAPAADIYVASSGRVLGRVVARHAVIAGRVDGPVVVQGSLYVERSAIVKSGYVAAPGADVHVEGGAAVECALAQPVAAPPQTLAGSAPIRERHLSVAHPRLPRRG